MKYSKQEQEEALARLREWMKPGDTVYTVLRNVSRSGMQREIGVVLIKGGNNGGYDLHPNHAVACVLGARLGKRDGVIVGGCGMDMGFHLVYNLGRTLFPDGFGVKSEGGIRPKSKEHAARLVKEGKTTFRGRNGDASGWDEDGGYALKHKWI